MSTQIENRVVEMQFENKQFEQGVQESLSTLDKLKNALNFKDSSKNLMEFSKATKNFNLNDIGTNVEKIGDRFSAMGAVGFTAMQRLTNAAIDAGSKIFSALNSPIQLMKTGGWARAMDIEDAKFQLKGLDVAWNKISDDINYGVADTAYGLDSAAKAASQLVASGVKFGETFGETGNSPMAKALRGISGVAAMTNSSYDEISAIFTATAGQGKLMTMQLRQLEMRGLNAAATLGKQLHKSEAEIRDMVTKGKIDFETFSKAMDEAFGEHAVDANNTFTGALSNMKFALKKIGAEFATPLIQNAIPIFNEIRGFINDIKKNMGPIFEGFSKIVEVVSKLLTNQISAIRQNIFGAQGLWKIREVLNNLGSALGNIKEAVIRIVAAVSTAFNQVFPKTEKAGSTIVNISKGIDNFTKKLIPSNQALLAFKNVLVIVLTVLKGAKNVISGIFKLATPIVSTIFKIVAAIAKLLVGVIALVSNLKIFKTLIEEIRKSGNIFTFIANKIKSVFSSIHNILSDTTTVTGQFVSKIKTGILAVVGIIGGVLYAAFNKIKSMISSFNFRDPIGSIVEGFRKLSNSIKDLSLIEKMMKGIQIAVKALGGAVMVVIGLFAKLGASVKSLFSSFRKDKVVEESIEMPMAKAQNSITGVVKEMSKLSKNPLTGLERGVGTLSDYQYQLDNTKTAFERIIITISKFASTLKTKLHEIKAGEVLLFAFGISVTILAVQAAKAFSSISKLTGGLTKFFGGLTDYLKNFGKKHSTFLQVMLGISAGLLSLAGALWIISQIPSDKLTSVAISLGALIAVIGTFTVLGAIFGKGSVAFAASMAAFALAIGVLVGSLIALNKLNVDITKESVIALVSICAGLLAISVILSKAAPSFVKGGLAILSFAAGCYILAKALKVISTADLSNVSDNWEAFAVVLLGFSAFAAMASSVGVGAVVGIIGFVILLKVAFKNVELIKQYFGGIQNALDAAADIIKSALNYFYEALKKVADDIEKSEVLAKVIGGSVVSLIAAIIIPIIALGHAGKGLKKAAMGFVMVAAAIAGLMFVTVEIAKFMETAKSTNIDKAIDLIKSIFIFVGTLALISSLPGEVGSYKANNGIIKEIRKLLISMSVLVLAIGGFAMMVGSLEVDQFERAKSALIAIGIVVGVIATISSIVTAVVSKGGKSEVSFGTFTGIVLLIGTLIGSMAVLLYMFNQVDLEKDKAKLITAGVAFAAICTAIILILAQVAKIEKAKEAKKKSKLGAIAAIIGIIAALAGLAYVINNFDADLKKAGIIAVGMLVFIGILGVMVVAIQYFSKKFMNTTIRMGSFALTMLAIGGMILAIMAIAGTLTNIANSGTSIGRMALIAGLLLGVLAALGAMVLALEKFAKDTKYSLTKSSKKNLLTTVLLIAGFLAAFVGLAKLFQSIEGLNVGRMALQALTITGVLLALSAMALGMIFLVKKMKAGWQDIGKAGAIFTGMIAFFGALVGLFTVIDGLQTDAGRLIGVSQMIVLALFELGAIGIAATKLLSSSNWVDLGKAGAALAGMVALFHWLTYIFTIIDGFQSTGGQLLGKSQTIMLVMAELVGIIEGMGALVNAGGLFIMGGVAELALWGIIALFKMLANVFVTIDGLKTEGIMAKSQTIVLVMLELVAIIEAMGALVMGAGIFVLGGLAELALWPMIGLFGMLAQVFTVIDGLQTDGIMAKSQTIILVMTELAGLVAVMGLLSPLIAAGGLASGGLVAMVGLFDELTMIFQKIDELGSNDLREKAQIIVETLLKLEGLSAIGGVIGVVLGPGIILLAEAIIMLGEACNVIGPGLETVALGLTTLSAGIMNVVATGPGIQMWFTNVATGVQTLATTIIETVNGLSESLATAVDTIITGIATAIVNGGSIVFSAAGELANKVKEGFESLLDPLAWGKELVQNFANGMLSGISAVATAASSVAHAVWERLHFSEGPEIGELAGGVVKMWGQELSEQYGLGIADGIPMAEGAADSLASGVADKIKNFDLSTIKEKGAGYVLKIIEGIDSEEGPLAAKIEEIKAMLRQLSDADLAYKKTVSSSWAKGSGTLDAYEHQLKTSMTSSRHEIEESNNSLKRLNGTTKEAKEAAKNYKDQIEISTAKGKQAKDEFAKLMGQEVKLTDATDAASESLNKFGDSAGKAGKGAGGAAKEMGDFTKKLSDTLNGQMDIFSKFEKKEAMSKDELLANMRSQIQGMTEWAAQMQALAAKGIDKGLYEKLAMMGPQGAEYVGAFAQMTAEELAEANQLWGQSLVLPDQVASQVGAAFNSIGTNIMAGWQQGMMNGMQPMVDTAVNGAQQAETGVKNYLGIQSPSLVFDEIGRFIMEGLAQGISTGQERPLTLMRIMCQTLVDIAKRILNPQVFYEIGKNVVLGLTRGLQDAGARAALNAAITELSTEMQAATEALNEIASPSKVYYGYGRYIVMGLANGISENTNLAVSSIEETGMQVINTMRDTIHSIGMMLTDEMEDPVIRPVLDLSNVQAGARTLNNMFTANQAMSASASMNLQNPQLNGVVGNTVFNQYNYSPKALSRAEIYRQTRNQFAQYREAMR